MDNEERPFRASDFGWLLRQHRLAAGLSQEALAERARMSSDGISALERGHRRTPQHETLALLAGALALDEKQREQFETTAAHSGLQRRLGAASVAVGPWGETGTSNLPLTLKSFVGREAELEEISTLVREHRMVTLTGAGGVGKTQTALHVATTLSETGDVPVCFVGLAPVASPALVVAAIASALGAQEVPNRPLLDTLRTFLKSKALLLILDNCEHVIAEAGAIAATLLSTCPGIRILATSREQLRAAGEYYYRLPSLSLPSREAAHRLGALDATVYGAIVLFTDRARAVDYHFALSDESAPIVAGLCRRLDGIPLAIELAAARVNLLSLKTLVEKLDDRFAVLTGGERTALPRQQTMRATIDWSYDLLSAQEQRLFERLSVFSGGFDLDAAVAVCGDEGLSDDIFDLLTSLTGKSLVVADINSECERYRLLESTAAYALEKLSASDERERLGRRHAKYFRERAEAADAAYGTGSTIAWLAGVESELDNYRAALAWALTRGNDAVLGGAIAGALQPADVGLIVDGSYWIELALARVSGAEHPSIAARLQLAASGLFNGKRRYEATERAIQFYDLVGDLRGAARAERLRGWAFYEMGAVDEARETTAQALAALRACGDTWGQAHCLNQLAYLESERCNLSAAREFYAQALAGNEAIGDEMGMSQVLGNMAESEFAAGNSERALRLVNEALELASFGKNLRLLGMWHQNSAAYRIALGDVAGGRESAREGLRVARQIRSELTIAQTLQHLALLAALCGDSRRGAQLLGYVDARYDHFGMKRERTEQWSYDALVAALRETLSNDEINELATEGAAWPEDKAVEETLNVG